MFLHKLTLQNLMNNYLLFRIKPQIDFTNAINAELLISTIVDLNLMNLIRKMCTGVYKLSSFCLATTIITTL